MLVATIFTGSCAELLSELKLFVEMLVHLEASIVKANTHNPQVNINALSTTHLR